MWSYRKLEITCADGGLQFSAAVQESAGRVAQRERSAPSIGVDPTGKHCADLFEHELR